MKVFSVEDIRRWDDLSMERQKISSLALMERAVYALWCAMKPDLKKRSSVGILCGPGNNGGDGLVLARMMQEEGIDTRVYLYGADASTDRNQNLSRYQNLWPERVEVLKPPSLRHTKHELLVDALFGSGLNRPVEDDLSSINQLGIPVWSIDVPSGMPGAWPSHPEERHSFYKNSLRAERTFTLQQPKRSFFSELGYALCGTWQVINIGLDPDFYKENKSDVMWLQAEDYLPLKPRKRFSHKGDFGHGCLLAGGIGKAGAAVMAAEACLTSGVGLLTLWVPEAIQSIMQISVPQAMTETADNWEHKQNSQFNARRFAAFAAGPGMGLKDTGPLYALLTHCSAQAVPLVLDADALNMLAVHPEWKPLLGSHTLLTPHPGELDRITGNKSADEFARLECARAYSLEHGCFLLLKGAYSTLCTPEGILFICSNGSPALAKAGSGDVLTGILLALLAQGLNLQQAGCSALLAHALSGEAAEASKGTHSATYRDLLECLPGILNP